MSKPYDDWVYYVENDHREFLCIIDGEIYWSQHVIDAASFDTEEAADEKIKELNLFFCGVSCRSSKPQKFLWSNPYLPHTGVSTQKTQRIPLRF